MANTCPDGQVLDRGTKQCRPPLKRGRKIGKNKTTIKPKKPCPDGQVLDRHTKQCRPPLKRGRTAKLHKSPIKVPNELLHEKNNETLDKYGFAIPVFRSKTYKDDKVYKQTTLLAFSKKT